MTPPIDGRFDDDADTGHARLDATLDAFASVNRDNPAAIGALDKLAARARTHPEELLAEDGSLRVNELADALRRELASVGSVEIPSRTGSIADGDIMAMAFIVMMEAAKSAQEDLRAIMDGVKAINREKEGWRQVTTTLDCLAARGADGELPSGTAAALRCQPIGTAIRAGDHVVIKAPGPRGSRTYDTIGVRDPATAKETVKRKLDSLSEMGEMESLRLQMAMDRLSKLMQTISNLLKKSSDTAAAIIANLK